VFQPLARSQERHFQTGSGRGPRAEIKFPEVGTLQFHCTLTDNSTPILLPYCIITDHSLPLVMILLPFYCHGWFYSHSSDDSTPILL